MSTDVIAPASLSPTAALRRHPVSAGMFALVVLATLNVAEAGPVGGPRRARRRVEPDPGRPPRRCRPALPNGSTPGIAPPRRWSGSPGVAWPPAPCWAWA